MSPGELSSTDVGTLLASLAIALVLGAVIGFDRERRGKPAGLRTHALVCVASCLAMMTSEVLGGATGHDSLRGLNAVMTGIGFIGAGAIMRYGRIVHGLTTGATIWTAGAVGVAVGAGWILGAIVATAAAVLVLVGLRAVEHALAIGGQLSCLRVQIAAGHPFPADMIGRLTDMRFEVLAVKIEPGADGAPTEVCLHLEGPVDYASEVAAAVLRSHEHVADVRVAPWSS